MRLPRSRHDELKLLRERRSRSRRGAALHPRRLGGRDDRRRRRSPAQSAHVRCIRFHQDDEPLAGRSRRICMQAVRQKSRRLRDGRGRVFARDRGARSRRAPRRVHLRRSARLRDEQRRLPHDEPRARRRMRDCLYDRRARRRRARGWHIIRVRRTGGTFEDHRVQQAIRQAEP